MINFKSQKGQAIILLAFAIIGLVGFGALAIDGGRALSDKRHAQNAADTAALAAALDIIHGGDSTSVINSARERALSNGYDDGSTLQDVIVNRPPVSGPYAGNNEYVQVIIRSTIQTTFARVIGRPQVTNTVEAVARAQGVSINPLATGAALAAFKKTGTPFTGGGNGTLSVIGSGIFSNSTDSDCPNGSMKLGGSITFDVDTAYTTATSEGKVGKVCTVGGQTLSDPVKTTGQVPLPSYDIPAPSFTCSGTGHLNGTEYQPGNYNGLNPPPDDYTFAPGNYCFSANVILNGGSLVANNVNIRLTNGASFTTKGTSTFTCSNVIIHSKGGSGAAFNGSSVNNCTGITFYMETGGVGWNGDVDNKFTAPTSEDSDYKGLLVYLPEGNSSAININGNSGSQFTGSIIALSSSVAISGNNNSEGLHTQILADTINFDGNGTTKIHYNPDELYFDPPNPSIEQSQ